MSGPHTERLAPIDSAATTGEVSAPDRMELPWNTSVTSPRLTDVEAAPQPRGWGVLTEAGVVHQGAFNARAARELSELFGSPSSRDGGLELRPVGPRSSDPRQTFSRRAGDASLHSDAAYHDSVGARRCVIEGHFPRTI